MKFRKKPVVIEAITFDELVQFGKDNGGNIVDGMPWSFTYKGQAITHENNTCYLIPTLEGTMRFTPEDMLITGVKGEIYPCKKDIFQATYDVESNSNLSFGDAVKAALSGKRVARSGWNGANMYAYIVPANSYPAQTDVAKKEFGEMVPYRAYWALKTAQNDIATWAPSGSDSLASDWIILD